MEINALTLVFRVLAILGGILIGIFSYQILRLTRGGLRGWKYIALFGGFLCFWAVTALITKLIGIVALERITGVIGLLGMAVSVPLAFAKMTDELNLWPKWFTAKGAVGVVAAVFLILLGLNVMQSAFMAHPLDKLLSIAHLTLGITAVIVLVPLTSLSVNIKKPFWIITTIAFGILAVSLLIGQHYDGCCGTGGSLADDTELCGQYDLPYVQVTQAPCFASLIPIAQYYQAYLTVGILILAVSFYRLAKGFKAFEKNA